MNPCTQCYDGINCIGCRHQDKKPTFGMKRGYVFLLFAINAYLVFHVGMLMGRS